MRCFFMKHGRICSVDYLSGKTDKELIEEARQLFETRGPAQGAEGFEVWDHTRFIYRFLVQGTPQPQRAQDGLRGPPNWLERVIKTVKPKFAGLETGPRHACLAT
jgi:hypothetical protein